MKLTGPVELAVPFAVLAALVYALLRAIAPTIPPLQYTVAIPIAALALGEMVAARRVRAVVRHDPEAKPMTAISIARCVALGKSSALVAAAMVGASGGLLLRVAPQAASVHAAGNDVRVGLVVSAASGLLLAAGLLLERSGVDPGQRSPARPTDRRPA